MKTLIIDFFKKYNNSVLILLCAFIALDIFLWSQIINAETRDPNLHLYFLNVGQGDSELIVMPGGTKLLIDGGPPNGRLAQELDAILPPTDRYIDLVMMTHPQLDHFGGFIDAFKRYRIGAFLWTGRTATISAFHELENVLKDNVIRTITLQKEDYIHTEGGEGEILSPSANLLESKELNDTSLVLKLTSASSTSLFTGDIGSDIENMLLQNGIGRIDILKVPHHGSRFSSSASFLDAIRPKIGVVEVGKNSYGHPTKQAMEYITHTGARLYRTDKDGRVEIISDGTKLSIIKNQ